MKLQFIFSVFIQLLIAGAFHAQRVFPLFEDISVDSVLQPKMWVSKMALDPITQHLFYTTAAGDIYEVFEDTQSDSLRFSVTDHGIPKVQGLCFVDSTVFLSGNIWYPNFGIGLIVKGVLQSNGSREWTTVLRALPQIRKKNIYIFRVGLELHLARCKPATVRIRVCESKR